MKLYLHIGTEKTASSFIQTSFARERKALLKEGFYYPTAGAREKDMLEGKISPGNASSLAKALSPLSASTVTALLRQWKREAEEQGVNQLILSNELLVGAFSKSSVFEQFKSCLDQEQIELTSVLIVIREPIGQALSLFKHRAKSGLIEPLPLWMEHKYEYLEVLNGFSSVLKEHASLIEVRAYTKDGDQLLKVFYQDWLGIQLPKNVKSEEVNPSLTLSELAYLAQLRAKNRWLAEDFYTKMIALPIEEKSDDAYLKKWAKNEIALFLSKDVHTWELYNEYIPINERIQLDALRNVKKEKSDEIYSFSNQQLHHMVEFNESQSKWLTKTVHLLKAGRLFLAKTKARLMPS
jgi:hypothetical protein